MKNWQFEQWKKHKQYALVYRLFVIVAYLWVIAFLTFFIVSVIAGGSAGDGKIEKGRYYLGSHGEYTEVSRVTYVACAVLEMVVNGILTFALFFVFLFCLFLALKEGGITAWGIVLFFGVLCFCWGQAFLICLRCILRAFGIM